MRGLAPLLLVALVQLLASTTHAYSDPAMFAQPAVRGGGDGRYYTGSPLDGYTCASCHRDGPTPGLAVYGLPEVLEPGTAYQITLRWTQPEVAHALQLELLTERGQTPEVSLPAAEQLSSFARCESAADGEAAVYAVDLPGRRILGVRDCGASELSFRFVAPEAQRVYLAASLVRSDSMGSARGDGVLDLRRTLTRRDGELEAGGGCALSHASGAPDGLFMLLAMLALRRGARASQRRRRGASLLGLLLSVGCYQPEQSADYTPVDAGIPSIDAAIAAPAAGMDAAAPGPELFFRVRTMAYGGKYAPRNVGAIWVERADGSFVKTLARWAGTRALYLRNWQRASAGDLTDAITGATLDAHRTHEVRWDFRDARGAAVADGPYKIGLELTDRDATGAVYYVPFVKGAGAPAPTLVPSAQFVDLELTVR